MKSPDMRINAMRGLSIASIATWMSQWGIIPSTWSNVKQEPNNAKNAVNLSQTKTFSFTPFHVRDLSNSQSLQSVQI